MFRRKKKNSHLSIELSDYILRAIFVRGTDIEQAQMFEVVIDPGIIEGETIVNEVALFDLLKKHLLNWGEKHARVRFFVQNMSVLMKSFEHPADLTGVALKEYVELEIGNSIHLPFKEPILDVYDFEEGDGKAMLFAVPSEEIIRLSSMLLDLQFHPEAADVRALCNVRFLEKLDLIDNTKTYLISDWSVNEISICIISQGNVDFLRFQSITTDFSKWTFTQQEGNTVRYTHAEEDVEEYRTSLFDQVLEIDRMMNFFKFSLHKGDREVDEIIIMGDNPHIHVIHQLITENLSQPAMIVDDELVRSKFPNFSSRFSSLIGLALKEVD